MSACFGSVRLLVLLIFADLATSVRLDDDEAQPIEDDDFQLVRDAQEARAPLLESKAASWAEDAARQAPAPLLESKAAPPQAELELEGWSEDEVKKDVAEAPKAEASMTTMEPGASTPAAPSQASGAAITNLLKAALRKATQVEGSITQIFKSKDLPTDLGLDIAQAWNKLMKSISLATTFVGDIPSEPESQDVYPGLSEKDQLVQHITSAQQQTGMLQVMLHEIQKHTELATFIGPKFPEAASEAARCAKSLSVALISAHGAIVHQEETPGPPPEPAPEPTPGNAKTNVSEVVKTTEDEVSSAFAAQEKHISAEANQEIKSVADQTAEVADASVKKVLDSVKAATDKSIEETLKHVEEQSQQEFQENSDKIAASSEAHIKSIVKNVGDADGHGMSVKAQKEATANEIGALKQAEQEAAVNAATAISAAFKESEANLKTGIHAVETDAAASLKAGIHAAETDAAASAAGVVSSAVEDAEANAAHNLQEALGKAKGKPHDGKPYFQNVFKALDENSPKLPQ